MLDIEATELPHESSRTLASASRVDALPLAKGSNIIDDRKSSQKTSSSTNITLTLVCNQDELIGRLYSSRGGSLSCFLYKSVKASVYRVFIA